MSRGPTMVVTGGRYWTQRDVVFAALDRIWQARWPIWRVFHGGAKGIDTMAADWAGSRGLDAVPFHAEWTKYGRRAGPRRNHAMLRRASETLDGALVVAFPGGRGTADCVRQARQMGIEVVAAIPRPRQGALL